MTCQRTSTSRTRSTSVIHREVIHAHGHIGSNQKSAVVRSSAAPPLVAVVTEPSLLVAAGPRKPSKAMSPPAAPLWGMHGGAREVPVGRRTRSRRRRVALPQNRDEPARAIEKPWPDSSWRQIIPERELVHV